MNNGVNTNQTNTNVQTQGIQTTGATAYPQPQVPQQPVIQQTVPVQQQPVAQPQIVQPTPVVQQATPVVQQQSVVEQPVIQQTAPVVQPQQPTVQATEPPKEEEPKIRPIALTAIEDPGKETKKETVEEEKPAEPVIEQPVEEQPKQKKKRFSLSPILFLIVLILGAYTVYAEKTHKSEIESLNYNCTAVTASKEETKLDLESTLVKDLYGKVETTLKEDLAQSYFNDNMKLYLAYRQIPDKDKYSSNCNLFDTQKMEPFKCEGNPNFSPKAFKVETLEREYKKLFGEKSQMPVGNVQLGSSCYGGYERIDQRGEFVQGYCSQGNATSYKVTKKLVEATSSRNIILLKEEVKYHENEGMALPDFLKSGYYYYTFRLDLNYNYVLVSKEYQSKY